MAVVFARNPKTGQRVMSNDGGQTWHIADAAPGSPVPMAAAPKLSAKEQTELIKQQEGAAAGLEAKQRIKEIAPALGRLKGGPWRGAFLSAAIPEGNGFLDALGGMTIGGIAKLTGAISDRDVKDYQQVRRAATLSTRQSETGERGTQTEGDAARALMSTVSPSTADPQTIVNSIVSKADRQANRAAFYTQWANRLGGLSKVDEHGRSVEQAFQQQLGHMPTEHVAVNPQRPHRGVVITKVSE